MAPETSRGFSSILVDIDATASAQPAVERAARLARTHGARLRIVDVVKLADPAAPPLRADVQDELMARRRQQLTRVAAGVRDVHVETEVLAGPPAQALIEEVYRHGHDLLVRAHARDVAARRPRPYGPIDVELFRRCPCPVWAVGPGRAPEYPRIVAALDVTSHDPAAQVLNAQIIDVARGLARGEQGSLCLLHAWRPTAEQHVSTHAPQDDYTAYIEHKRLGVVRSMTDLLEASGESLIGTRVELRRGHVDDVVPEFAVAEGIDVVVMGTFGRKGIARYLLGNTAERLLNRLPCSVVAVKPTADDALCEAVYARR